LQKASVRLSLHRDQRPTFMGAARGNFRLAEPSEDSLRLRSWEAFFTSIDPILLGRKTYDVSARLGRRCGRIRSQVKNYVLHASPPEAPGRTSSFVTNRSCRLAQAPTTEDARNIWMMVRRQLMRRGSWMSGPDHRVQHPRHPVLIGEGSRLSTPPLGTSLSNSCHPPRLRRGGGVGCRSLHYRVYPDVAYALLACRVRIPSYPFFSGLKTRPHEWGRCTHECVRHVGPRIRLFVAPPRQFRGFLSARRNLLSQAPETFLDSRP